MFGRVLPIDVCATACLLEHVVHADDLAVSIGQEPVRFSGEAITLVVETGFYHRPRARSRSAGQR